MTFCQDRVDRSNPHEIIPISFDMKAILKEKYYSIVSESKYLVQTCSQVRQRNKVTRSTWCRQRCRSLYKTRMDKSQRLKEKSRLEQDREDPRREVDIPIQAQSQVQSNRKDYVKQ